MSFLCDTVRWNSCCFEEWLCTSSDQEFAVSSVFVAQGHMFIFLLGQLDSDATRLQLLTSA